MRRNLFRSLVALAALSTLVSTASRAAPAAAVEVPDPAAAATEIEELLGQLVAADMTNPPGNESRGVAIGAARLRAAGIPFEVTSFATGRENLVARLKGDGSERPILLLAHIDVVGTEGQPWTTAPKQMTRTQGPGGQSFLAGRGVLDDLGMAALELVVLERLKSARVPLRRDVIVAWTGDEESGGLGIQWLLQNRPELIDAEFVVNEGGSLLLGDDGAPKTIELQVAEKVYQDFELTTVGPTGHSSVPLADNAINRLAAALDRLARHRFPLRLLPVTRAWLEESAGQESPELAAAMRTLARSEGPIPEDALALVEADPTRAATLRTTCIATVIEGGSRVNALPASAKATVNCRILPDRTPDEIEEELARILDDPAVEIEPVVEMGFGEPSPLDGAAADAIRAVSNEMYPDVPIVPFMSRGATDSRFLRGRGLACYGINPIGVTSDDARRAHGIDERIPRASLGPAFEFLYRLVTRLAAK